ncbi:hypothetical protein ACWEQL_08565 [Kitasatospora sp. NPDC004240]
MTPATEIHSPGPAAAHQTDPARRLIRPIRETHITDDQPQWTGALTERLRCCICGGPTTDAPDYVLIELTAAPSSARQWLGAHGAHLNGVLAQGFSAEVHLM